MGESERVVTERVPRRPGTMRGAKTGTTVPRAAADRGTTAVWAKAPGTLEERSAAHRNEASALLKETLFARVGR
jgi:hypothetical protein